MSNLFDFSTLISDPASLETIPRDQLPALLIQLSTVQTAMAARLVAARESTAGVDTLLTVDEAAARLGVSADWLYRRTKNLPFVMRVGRHVRFSARGIEAYIKRRVGAG